MQQKGLGDQNRGRKTNKRQPKVPVSRSLVRTMINGKQVLLNPSVVLKKYPTIKTPMPDPVHSTIAQPKKTLPQGTANRKKKESLTKPAPAKIINQHTNPPEDTDDLDIYMDSLLDEEIERNLDL